MSIVCWTVDIVPTNGSSIIVYDLNIYLDNSYDMYA